MAMVRGVVILLPCPCVPCRRRAKSSNMEEMFDEEIFDTEFLPWNARPAPYPHGPVETAYGNPETYGPEGEFELAVSVSGGPARVVPPELARSSKIVDLLSPIGMWEHLSRNLAFRVLKAASLP
jgi:hypothetical protein